VNDAEALRYVPAERRGDVLADPFWPKKVRDGLDFHHCRYTNVCEALDRRHRQVRCQTWMTTTDAAGRKVHRLHAPEDW